MSNKILKTRLSQDIHCYDCSSRHLCIAGGLLHPQIEGLNKIIQYVRILKKKDHLFYARSPMKNLYAVYQGSCKEYWIDEKGNECVTNFYFPGDLIGVESIADKTHLLSLIALEYSRICVIPLGEFYAMMQEEEAILKRFINITGFKIRNDRSTKMGVTANERVSDFLLNIISRMLERNQTEKNIYLPMSQLDISNFLGIAHETVNRIFKNLTRQKIIKIKNKKMDVLDIEKLERLSRLDYSFKK